MFMTLKHAGAVIAAAVLLAACATPSNGGNGNGNGNGNSGERIPYDAIEEFTIATTEKCDEKARLAWYKRAVEITDEDAAPHEIIPAVRTALARSRPWSMT